MRKFLIEIDGVTYELDGDSPEDALRRAGFDPTKIVWIVLTVKDVEDIFSLDSATAYI